MSSAVGVAISRRSSLVKGCWYFPRLRRITGCCAERLRRDRAFDESSAGGEGETEDVRVSCQRTMVQTEVGRSGVVEAC